MPQSLPPAREASRASPSPRRRPDTSARPSGCGCPRARGPRSPTSRALPSRALPAQTLPRAPPRTCLPHPARSRRRRSSLRARPAALVLPGPSPLLAVLALVLRCLRRQTLTTSLLRTRSPMTRKEALLSPGQRPVWVVPPDTWSRFSSAAFAGICSPLARTRSRAPRAPRSRRPAPRAAAAATGRRAAPRCACTRARRPRRSRSSRASCAASSARKRTC